MGVQLSNQTRRIFTVSEITTDLKELIEDNFASVWLKGEVSNLKLAASGHCYFTLKDAGAQISCVMFKGSLRTLKFRPEDGLQMVVHGALTLYEAHGKYQIIADHMEPDGVGALQLAFEQLKKKLGAEGLFDAARKRPLPFLPQTVGIVTSAQGAAVHDLLSVLKRRFPNINIILYPVKVQGVGAKEEIAHALDYFSHTHSVDVVIVGRGGGSIEDLWAFNEEIVARAVAACVVPVISAVGHETDFTICDFVADVRAATPSAAAELCVPRRSDLEVMIQKMGMRLVIAQKNRIALWQNVIKGLTRKIPTPLALWRRLQLRLGDIEDRLQQNALLLIRQKKYDLAELQLKISDPRILLRDQQNRFRELQIKLQLLSPKGLLKRGYVIATRDNGHVVINQKDLNTGDFLNLNFQDGIVKTRIV